MEEAYAQALWQAIKGGKTPKEAVSAVHAMLVRQGRLGLIPRIERALKRLAARESAARPKLFVAHQKDAKHALEKSGLDEADVYVDETLIGGWRLESADTLVDNTYKSRLLEIYSSVTK